MFGWETNIIEAKVKMISFFPRFFNIIQLYGN